MQVQPSPQQAKRRNIFKNDLFDCCQPPAAPVRRVPLHFDFQNSIEYVLDHTLDEAEFMKTLTKIKNQRSFERLHGKNKIFENKRGRSLNNDGSSNQKTSRADSLCFRERNRRHTIFKCDANLSVNEGRKSRMSEQLREIISLQPTNRQKNNIQTIEDPLLKQRIAAKQINSSIDQKTNKNINNNQELYFENVQNNILLPADFAKLLKKIRSTTKTKRHKVIIRGPHPNPVILYTPMRQIQNNQTPGHQNWIYRL